MNFSNPITFYVVVGVLAAILIVLIMVATRKWKTGRDESATQNANFVSFMRSNLFLVVAVLMLAAFIVWIFVEYRPWEPKTETAVASNVQSGFSGVSEDGLEVVKEQGLLPQDASIPDIIRQSNEHSEAINAQTRNTRVVNYKADVAKEAARLVANDVAKVQEEQKKTNVRVSNLETNTRTTPPANTTPAPVQQSTDEKLNELFKTYEPPKSSLPDSGLIPEVPMSFVPIVPSIQGPAIEVPEVAGDLIIEVIEKRGDTWVAVKSWRKQLASEIYYLKGFDPNLEYSIGYCRAGTKTDFIDSTEFRVYGVNLETKNEKIIHLDPDTGVRTPGEWLAYMKM